MKIIFEKQYLEDLYRDGITSKKKYKFQSDVVKRYVQKIEILRALENIMQLKEFRSLRYEKLKGDKKGLESIRVNKAYRIEFISSIDSDEITICSIIELSNHYEK